MYKKGMDLSKYLAKYPYFPKFTKFLFGEFAQEIRDRGCMYQEDLILIYIWKTQLWQYLRSGEVKSLGVEQDEQRIVDVSQWVFQIDHENRDDVVRLLKDLTSLRGVGAKVASTILAVIFPDKYGIFDIHIQKALGITTRDEQAAAEAIFRMREIAKEQESLSGRPWTPREVDQALWVLNRPWDNAADFESFDSDDWWAFLGPCEICGRYKVVQECISCGSYVCDFCLDDKNMCIRCAEENEELV